MDNMELKEDNSYSEHPERPLDCSECARPIAVHYTEIVGTVSTHTGMCSECPQLERRLKGTGIEGEFTNERGPTTLVCGECGTTLDNFLVSRHVGCSNCYEVFDVLIVEEMLKSSKISPTITKRKLSVPIHVGRILGETQKINPTLRLIALNETLEETLKREDYEQAAWLRDQIKAITEEKEKNNAGEE